MNSVLDVYNAAASETNPLSPKNLANDLEGLASALCLLQGYALVLERQPQLIAPVDDLDLVHKTAVIQTRFRRHATFALNRLTPEAIKVVTDVDAFANLMSALKVTLPQIDTDTSSLSAILLSVESNIADYQINTSELAVRSERELGKVDAAEKTLDEAITNMIAKLEKPDGKISRVRDEISAKKEEIEINITAIVQSGSALSGSVRDLVTGILTSFVPSVFKEDSQPDKDDRQDVSNTTDAEESIDEGSIPEVLLAQLDEDAATSSHLISTTPPLGLNVDTDVQAADTNTETFSVESIGAIESNFSQGKLSVNQLIQNNHELADLYRKLAQLNGLLAAVKAIRDQIHDYSKALQVFAIHVDHVENSWSQIQSGFKEMETAPYQSSADGTVIMPLATVAVAVRHWQRVSDRTDMIKSTLGGLRSSFSNLDNPEPAFG